MRTSSPLLALVVAVLPASLLAHGGSYSGWRDEEGRATPCFGAPLPIEPPFQGAPSFANLETRPSLARARAIPVVPPEPTEAAADPALDWSRWWRLNEARYHPTRLYILDKGQELEPVCQFGSPSWPLSPRIILTQLRQAVLAIVRLGLNDPYFDTRAAAAIALGKVSDPTSPSTPEIIAELRKLLTDADKVVRESAVLGLGLLGDKSQVPDLLLIMKDDPKAREFASVWKNPIPTRMRGFAAIAIGLIGSRETLDDSVIAELAAAARGPAADSRPASRR